MCFYKSLFAETPWNALVDAKDKRIMTLATSEQLEESLGRCCVRELNIYPSNSFISSTNEELQNLLSEMLVASKFASVSLYQLL